MKTVSASLLVLVGLSLSNAGVPRKDGTPGKPVRDPTPLGLVDLPSQVKGTVVSLMVKQGQKVQIGEVILRLDDRRARLEAERAKAHVALAEAELAVQIAELRVAENNFKRADALSRSKAISSEELGGARAALDKAQLETIVKKELVKLKKLDVDEAQLILETHQVVSPVVGVVDLIYRQPGEAVKELEPVVRIKIANQ